MQDLSRSHCATGTRARTPPLGWIPEICRKITKPVSERQKWERSQNNAQGPVTGKPCCVLNFSENTRFPP
ncbi:hypothetical protein GCM10017567_58190 [Amycolatopsis bullii]|uniref:Uncharacterized protein n=1 Tax=Amycolatopsis bullii TaxID=941987 RepID=A0ABQ3KJ53_9PSEU|nr:hypothetical protein GCM10017567_58190 [Amycolatopsis bullii]